MQQIHLVGWFSIPKGICVCKMVYHEHFYCRPISNFILVVYTNHRNIFVMKFFCDENYSSLVLLFVGKCFLHMQSHNAAAVLHEMGFLWYLQMICSKCVKLSWYSKIIMVVLNFFQCSISGMIIWCEKSVACVCMYAVTAKRGYYLGESLLSCLV